MSIGIEEKIIICWRVSKAEYVHPEALRGACAFCSEEIWAAPSSNEVSQKPGWKLVCRECAQMILVKQGPIEFGGHVTPKNPRPWENDGKSNV